jgi:hypothetical protein
VLLRVAMARPEQRVVMPVAEQVLLHQDYLPVRLERA